MIELTVGNKQEFTFRINRLLVTFRSMISTEIADGIKKFEEKNRYQMKRVFNFDIGWLSFENKKFEQSTNFYIQNGQLLEIFVFYPYVEKKPSGKEACLSIPFAHNDE